MPAKILNSRLFCLCKIVTAGIKKAKLINSPRIIEGTAKLSPPQGKPNTKINTPINPKIIAVINDVFVGFG